MTHLCQGKIAIENRFVGWISFAASTLLLPNMNFMDNYLSEGKIFRRQVILIKIVVAHKIW